MDLVIFDMDKTEVIATPERSFSDVLRDEVLQDLKTNPLHSERPDILVIAEAMKPDWWARRENLCPWEVTRELYIYAKERKEREEQRSKQAFSLPSAQLPAQQDPDPPQGPGRTLPGAERPRSPRPRRQSRLSGSGLRRPERGTSHKKHPKANRPVKATRNPVEAPQHSTVAPVPVTLSVPVDAPIRAVLDRTALYLVDPSQRPVFGLPEVKVKPWNNLSARSQEDYRRGAKQVLADMKFRGVRSAWDMAGYLAEVARDSSLSTYKRRRNVVIRLLTDRKPEALAVVQALPPYSEMCELLGRETTSSTTEVTRARRARQNPKTWEKLLDGLSPGHRDAILVLRHTGARVSEGRSIRLQEEPAGIRVTIQTSKTGARQKQNLPSERSWVIPSGTVAGEVLSGVLSRSGPAPCPYSPDSLRAAWRRVRLKEELNKDSHWDLHSLRHQAAKEWKTTRAKEMKETYGPDWRRKLFGRQWQDSDDYKNLFYGDIAYRLGHSCLDMSKIYG